MTGQLLLSRPHPSFILSFIHLSIPAAPPVFIAPAPPRLSPAEEQMLTVEEHHDEQPKSSGESSDSTVKENCNVSIP